MSKHISRERRDSAQKKIKDKIKVLEGYCSPKKRVPKGAYIPDSEEAFRRWHDPKLGLEKIGSPNTMNMPHNRALKMRAAELIKELARRKNRRQGRVEINNILRSEVKEKDRLIRDLTGQYHAVKHELDRSHKNERRLKSRNSEQDKEIADLTQQLTVIKGFRSVIDSRRGGRQ